MERVDEEVLEPMSPNGQCLTTSVVTFFSIAVLEFEIPLDIDESQVFSLVRDVFLPINPRFSSILVVNGKNKKQWKKVEVNIEDHIKFPIFSPANSTGLYDDAFNEFLTKISMEKLQESKPLWEIYIIKYPTTEAAGFMVIKYHHCLGDGFSFMAVLLSCLKRADNPSLPLTFPSVQIHRKPERNNYKKILKIVRSIYYTVSDFGASIGFSSGFLEDDISAIRSAHHGVEFLPTTTMTMSFSLDSMKQIKNKLGVTINDVLSGMIYLGSRLYMEAEREGSGKARATSLVLLNTRMFRGYKSIQEMLKPDSEVPWGNNFTFLHVPIPKLDANHIKDPLEFVWKGRKIIQRKRNSFGLFLTEKFLKLVRKVRGTEAVAKYIHGTMKYTSMAITNLIGPIEQMALANHPVKGFYFLNTGAPMSISMGAVSYNGRLKICTLMEKDFMDPDKFKLSVENAFNLIYEAACGS